MAEQIIRPRNFTDTATDSDLQNADNYLWLDTANKAKKVEITRLAVVGDTAATESDMVSDSKIPIMTANGPKALPGNVIAKASEQTALTTYAQNLAASTAAAFVAAASYPVGKFTNEDGRLYRSIFPHSGAWNAAHFVAVNSSDYGELDIARKFNMVGANGTSVIKYIFLARDITKIRVVATPNPWDTSSVTGTNPAIFEMKGLKADGTLVNIFTYYINDTIPSVIEKDVPSGVVAIRCFFRASAGVNVSVSIEAMDYITAKSDIAAIDGRVTTIENDVTLRGHLDISMVGANGTAKYHEVVVDGYRYVRITPTPVPWATSTVTGTNPVILDVYALDAAGVSTTLYHYTISATLPNNIFCVLPTGTKKLKIMFRANLGTVVNFNFQAVADQKLGDAEAVSINLVGVNGTSVTRYIDVSEAVQKIAIDIDPANWPVNTVTGTNPALFELFAEDSTGNSLLRIYHWDATYRVNGPFVHDEVTLPSGTARLRIFFRGNAGERVKFVAHSISNYLQFSIEDKLRIYQNRYRRNKIIPQCIVVGDPHDGKEGMESAINASNLTDSVNFILCVGDIDRDNPNESDAYGNYPELFKSKIPVLPVVGNHDVGSGYYVGGFRPTADVVQNVMGPAIAKGFIPSNNSGYYYKDIAGVRVIVLNQYELGGKYGTGNKWAQTTYDSSKPNIALSTSYTQGDVVNIPGWTDYSYVATENVTTPSAYPSSYNSNIPCWHDRRPNQVIYGQTQAQWLADTLLSTPANYGVVIAMHDRFSTNAVVDNTRKFTAKDASTSGSNLLSGTDVVANLVEAFINGSNYSETVAFDTLDPYSVSCNFANKSTGVKFLGFVAGHFHADLVFKHSTKSGLNAIHVSSVTSNSNGDIMMFSLGNTYFCNLTLIGFDVSNNALNLIKVGRKLTDDGYLRDCERIVNA